MTPSTDPSTWLLTADERGNPSTVLDRRHDDGKAWTTGNRVVALVHGATYFRRLHEVLTGLTEGDLLCFTDWRGDPDERLTGEPGSEVRTVLCGAAERGVVVKGLLWRSHLDGLRYSSAENRHLGDAVNEAGGEVLLDQRVRPFGSHHQKLVVVRTDEHAVAFAGGIDLCHSRRDDATHAGDRQPIAMADEYGEHPPWHDVQLEVHGPAVGDLETVFRERWADPAPLDNRVRLWISRKLDGSLDTDASEMPGQRPDPDPGGTCTVQVLRTYAARRAQYPFAAAGERSVAAAYKKVMGRARRIIYLEDQYLWSTHVATLFADALRAQPDMHLVAVVPRFTDEDSPIARWPAMVGRQDALDMVQQAGGERVAVFDIENHAGTPVYVHAKVCVVDDVWASIGSDNLNVRSWTHDSELSCAVLDTELDGREPVDPAGLGDMARRFARELRLELVREHLDADDDEGIIDPVAVLHRMRASALALDAWHAGGRQGPRPPGRLRVHTHDATSAVTRAWARPMYHLVVDPDGRPRAGLRRRW